MKCFISAGVKFYTLAPGEPYPDPYEGNNYAGAYVVFLYEGKWYAQMHTQRRWHNLTDKGFSTENEAINFVYERFLSGEDNSFRFSRD